MSPKAGYAHWEPERLYPYNHTSIEVDAAPQDVLFDVGSTIDPMMGIKIVLLIAFCLTLCGVRAVVLSHEHQRS